LLVAGGGFGSIGGISNTSIAAWDGTQWVALGSGVDDEVYALLPVPSASAGVDLIVAGYFENAGGVQATHVARWDGSSWSAMGAGLGNPGPLGGVRELEYLDPDGAGPQPSRIVAAGDFYRGDGPGGVAYWTGEGWLQIGTMVGTPMSLFDIAGGDFGNGFELVACGKQSGQPGGVPGNLARLVGNLWEPYAGGADRTIDALVAFQSPSGSTHLVAHGSFTQVGTVRARAFAILGCEGSCYPDCNSDGLLNLSDFGCFQTKFALGDPYADCNGDGVRNLSDFGCFQTKFALGCP
jgi:hypothetical protein